jgi:segregation and condensation protein A
MSYHVKLEVFEGPLDLLLFFIQRDEVNIYDIPIAYITKEYLEYLALMEDLNLHLAGEFILMASMLMRIKAQMLLPRTETPDAELVEDPRTELVEMLIEYKKYKDASEFLRNLRGEQERFYPVSAEAENAEIDPELFLADVNLIDLSLMFQRLMKTLPKPRYYEIETLQITINQQREFIHNLFVNRARIRYSAMAKQLKNKLEVVVTFLAILEMVRTGELRVSQNTIYGDILLSKINPQVEHVIANA